MGLCVSANCVDREGTGYLDPLAIFVLPTVTVDDVTAGATFAMLFTVAKEGVATTLRTGLGTEELEACALTLAPVLRVKDGVDEPLARLGTDLV